MKPKAKDLFSTGTDVIINPIVYSPPKCLQRRYSKNDPGHTSFKKPKIQYKPPKKRIKLEKLQFKKMIFLFHLSSRVHEFQPFIFRVACPRPHGFCWGYPFVKFHFGQRDPNGSRWSPRQGRAGGSISMAMRSMALKAWRGGPGRLGHIFLFCKKASAYILL